MKTQGFEARFSQNLAPVSQEKPQNPYHAYISHLFSQPYLGILGNLCLFFSFLPSQKLIMQELY
ncbi:MULTISPECIES: hypothetical protein [Microcystis]|uniref:hypothetical protein n=1 Tax=Microcystis TaxID=1125 RepID=UPI0009313D56|nr:MULTISPECIES: hypothetical protein [Microcystis]TRT66413.1 MAG: hypothetical protein EWV68_14955 [Microcystis sp. M_QC_C_20170808_M9Col]MCA2721081.1 hypothetical protein [Microcystis sp. M176S2]MCA2726868.1 hypothetical protein [Microcystis sp. M166S2]MCA2745342.1 hypothetical protein [Microcystis sp. M155S2]MCA2768156.1 hypothetical protein [Microcystis sp. M152S2]